MINIVIGYNEYSIVITETRHYLIRGQKYIGDFVNIDSPDRRFKIAGEFKLKEPFQFAPGYEPKKDELKEMKRAGLTDEVPKMPSEKDLRRITHLYICAVPGFNLSLVDDLTWREQDAKTNLEQSSL